MCVHFLSGEDEVATAYPFWKNKIYLSSQLKDLREDCIKYATVS